MDADDFRFRRQGRSNTTLYTVIGVWAAVASASLFFDASLWLMGLIGLFTVPAIWDLYTNPASGLDFGPRQLTWFTGRREGSLDWSEIARFRLDTRLDFSVRASAVLHSGKKVRLPYECTPPHALFEAALNARGIRTERHHFSLIG